MANIKITGLTVGTALTGTEKFEAVQSAASVSLTAAQVGVYASQRIIQYDTPLAAANVTVTNGTQNLILAPAGTLATLTITLPSAPVNGLALTLSSTTAITALTLTPGAGQTVANTTSTIAAGTGVTYVYRSANSTWYKVGN